MQTIQLRCLECKKEGSLVKLEGSLRCSHCGAEYPMHSYKSIPLLVGLHSPLKKNEILNHKVVAQYADLERARGHWETCGMDDYLGRLSGLLLNYGSGDGGDRQWLESKGFTVTTFDIYPGEFTDYVCDGHDLPFADNQFDVVTSIAVFEHLYDPHKAVKEIFRVTKSGGSLVGSVAFLEPYHAFSYFHMSPLGVREVLLQAGYTNITIKAGWSYLESIGGTFWIWNRSRFIRNITRTCNRMRFKCGLTIHKLAYRIKGRKPPEELDLTFAGSLVFTATKP